MAINWEDIEKQSSYLGQRTSIQITPKGASEVIKPKVKPRPLASFGDIDVSNRPGLQALKYQTEPIKMPTVKPTAQPTALFGNVLDEYNISRGHLGKLYAQQLSEERKQEMAEGTKTWIENAPFQAGYLQGVALTNPLSELEQKLGTTIDAEKGLGYRAGEMAGIMTQFGAGYGGATKGIGQLTAKALPKLGKVGANIARNIATDIAVGLPLNVNIALVKEELEGKEAVKNIALNTAIDLLASGAIELIPVGIKGIKHLRNKKTGKIVGQVTDEVAEQATKAIGKTEIPKGKITRRPLRTDKAKAEGIFTDYYPEHRAKDVVKSSDYHPVSVELGVDPDEMVTIYRGSPEGTLNNGDWVTTSEQLAKDYAGSGKVVKEQVPAKHLYAPKGEGVEELIYSTNQKGLGATDIPLQGSTTPLESIKAETGSKVPVGESMAKTGDILEPKVKPEIKVDTTSKIGRERLDNEYNLFMGNTDGMAESVASAGVKDFADKITGKGVGFTKDIYRNLEKGMKNTPEGLAYVKKNYFDKFAVAKKQWVDAVESKTLKLKSEVLDKMGIDVKTKESAATQWIGEGQRQVDGKLVKYTLDDLKKEFSYTMKNGKKAWENIVELDKTISGIYDEYVTSINDALRKIYPSVETEVAKMERKLVGATADEAELILKQIDEYVTGKRLVPRQDYYHHFQELSQGFFADLESIVHSATNLDPNIVGLTHMTQPKSKWAGWLQHRGKGAYTEDALQGVLNYINQAEYKINVEPMIPEFRGLIKELRQTTSGNANALIEQLLHFTNELSGKTNALDRAVLTLLGDGKGRKIFNVIDKVSARVRANMIVGSINTALSQLFNFPNVAYYATKGRKNPKLYAEGVADLFTGLYEGGLAMMGDAKYSKMIEQSPFLTERYAAKVRRAFDSRIVKKPGKFFSWMLEVGDEIVADGAWMTFHKQAERNGLKGMDAILYADEFTRKSIAGRGVGEMPQLQRSKVTKILAPFQVEVANQWEVLKEAVTEKEFQALMTLFVVGYIMNETKEDLTGVDTSINPIGVIIDAIEEGKADEIPARMLGHIMMEMPYGSYLGEGLKIGLDWDDYQMQRFFGSEDPSRFGTGPVGINAFTRPLGQIGRGQNVDLLKPLTAIAPPLGGRQIEKTVRGLQDMALLPKETINLKDGVFKLEKSDFPASYSATGKMRFPIEDKPSSYLKAGLFGTWSLPEAREYFEGGGKTLSDNKTQTVKDLAKRGLGSKEAYNIVKAFPTGVEKQRQYIMSQDLTGKQKNELGKLVSSDKTVNYSSQTDYDFSILPKTTKEKYVKFGGTKEQFVKVVNATKGLSTDIERAYAMLDIIDDEKAYEAFGISADSKEGYISTVAKAKQLKANGIKAADYVKAKKASDANGSNTISKTEAINYLETTNLSREQKRAMLQALVPNLKTINNPY